jgi:hypothetical protein
VSTQEGTFNHRTAAISVITIGLVGALLELAGPVTVVPRLALFAGVLVAGVVYLVRVIHRSRRLGRSRLV